MSYLADHARATRALADAFAAESGVTHDKGIGAILAAMSLAFNGAAAEMEAQAKGSTLDTACTIDHAALKVAKCPACQSPRR